MRCCIVSSTMSRLNDSIIPPSSCLPRKLSVHSGTQRLKAGTRRV